MTHVTIKTLFCHLCATVLLAALTGCTKSAAHPDVPLERSGLILRFFDSMYKNDAATAAAQADKLNGMVDARNQAYLMTVHETQLANAALWQVEQALEQDDLAGAQQTVKAFLQQFPTNVILNQTQKELADSAKILQLAADLKQAEPAQAAPLIAKLSAVADNDLALQKYLAQIDLRNRLKILTQKAAFMAIRQPALANDAVGVDLQSTFLAVEQLTCNQPQ